MKNRGGKGVFLSGIQIADMEVYQHIQNWLGLNSTPGDLTYLQIALRAVIVFIISLVIVRLGAKRFLARKSAFDMILAFMLGSMLSRAINGSAPFFETLVGGLVLVAVHRFLAILSYRFKTLGRLVKGGDDVVIEDGKMVEKAMRKNHFTENDLLEDLRLTSHESPAEVKCARIERSGELSAIPKEKGSVPPKRRSIAH